MASKMSSRSSPLIRYNEIVCVGGGLAAISLGSQLQIQYNFTDFHIYDKNDGIGGTWWANTYPGISQFGYQIQNITNYLGRCGL